jgi:siroheme synthase
VTRILVQPATTSVFQPQPKQTAQQKPSERGGGKAYLVGVGPGDPSLITVKAADVLRSADMVFCFSWMKDEIAPFVPAGALEVASPFLMGGQYCGQRPEDVSADLRDRVVRTNQELGKLKTRVQKLVAEGKTVVFADNGDPLIFSPWGWVPEHLGEVSPVVVPGISSFNAANAALKRGVVGLGSVTLSSGAELGRPDDNGRLAGTIVFFTHGAKLKELAPKLQERYPADTPFAIVCEASYPTEKVIRGALGDLQKLLGQEKLPLLYLLYVGDGLK